MLPISTKNICPHCRHLHLWCVPTYSIAVCIASWSVWVANPSWSLQGPHALALASLHLLVSSRIQPETEYGYERSKCVIAWLFVVRPQHPADYVSNDVNLGFGGVCFVSWHGSMKMPATQCERNSMGDGPYRRLLLLFCPDRALCQYT